MTSLSPLTELAAMYTITKTERGYRLTTERGASYLLVRNVHTPEALFPVSASGNLPTTLRGKWFTDRDYRAEG